MSAPSIAPPLAGNVLGLANNHFVIAEWQDAGGPPRWIAPLHLHRNDDEAWYVLEGRLCVKMGDEEVELRAGSGVLVPRGTSSISSDYDPEDSSADPGNPCDQGAQSGDHAGAL